MSATFSHFRCKTLYFYYAINNSHVEKGQSKETTHETWVFYPAPIDKIGTKGFDIETNIRRIELSPVKKQDHLLDHLNRVIGEITSEE